MNVDIGRRLSHKYYAYLAGQRFGAAKRYLKGDVLDLGCGSGALAQHVKPGNRYVGVDMFEQQSALTSRTAHLANREFYVLNFELVGQIEATVASPSFDTICLLAVIEHLHEPDKVLTQCRTLLREHGVLILTTPSARGEKINILCRRMLEVGRPSRFPPHLRIYDQRQMLALLQTSGFRLDVFKRFELGSNQLFVASRL